MPKYLQIKVIVEPRNGKVPRFLHYISPRDNTEHWQTNQNLEELLFTASDCTKSPRQDRC